MILKHTALFLLVLLAFAGYAQDSVRLKLNLKKGDRFKITNYSTSTTTVELEEETVTENDIDNYQYQYDVVKVNNNGTFLVDITVLNIIKKTDGEQNPIQEKMSNAMIGFKYSIVLDTTGAVVEIIGFNKFLDKLYDLIKKEADKDIAKSAIAMIEPLFTDDIVKNTLSSITTLKATNTIKLNDTINQIQKNIMLVKFNTNTNYVLTHIKPDRVEFSISGGFLSDTTDTGEGNFMSMNMTEVEGSIGGTIEYFRDNGLLKHLKQTEHIECIINVVGKQAPMILDIVTDYKIERLN